MKRVAPRLLGHLAGDLDDLGLELLAISYLMQTQRKEESENLESQEVHLGMGYLLRRLSRQIQGLSAELDRHPLANTHSTSLKSSK